MGKQKIKIESVFIQGNYEILMSTDNFGNWKYGLFYNKVWQQWSWDFDKLKSKIPNN